MKDLAKLERAGETIPVPDQHKPMFDDLAEVIYVSRAAFETASLMRQQADKQLHDYLRAIMPELKEWKYAYLFKECAVRLIVPEWME